MTAEFTPLIPQEPQMAPLVGFTAWGFTPGDRHPPVPLDVEVAFPTALSGADPMKGGTITVHGRRPASSPGPYFPPGGVYRIVIYGPMLRAAAQIERELREGETLTANFSVGIEEPPR